MVWTLAQRSLAGSAAPKQALGSPPASGAEDVGEVELDRFVELFVGARAGVTVGAPADELGGVPEPGAFHVVVADLHDAFRAQRSEGQVLARGPPAGFCAAGRPGALLLLGPRPRVAVERGDQRLHLLEQLLAALHRERANHAHAGQLAVGVVK